MLIITINDLANWTLCDACTHTRSHLLPFTHTDTPLSHTHTHTHTHNVMLLQATLDSGNASIPEDANVHDIATLLKQYFRELPEPLITSRLFPVFEACYTLAQPAERQRCMLLACLLLPQVHLQVWGTAIGHRSLNVVWVIIIMLVKLKLIENLRWSTPYLVTEHAKVLVFEINVNKINPKFTINGIS